jgi:hypothetical protein
MAVRQRALRGSMVSGTYTACYGSAGGTGSAASFCGPASEGEGKPQGTGAQRSTSGPGPKGLCQPTGSAWEPTLTDKMLRAALCGAFVLAALGITFYVGNVKAHPGALAAIGLGLVFWFFVDLPQPDAPFGMVVGGAMGVIDWQDGLRFWCGAFALFCLWCARSAQRTSKFSE